MALQGTHIPDKILESRNKRISEEHLLKEVQEVLEREQVQEDLILQKLKQGIEAETNVLQLEFLETSKIYHLTDIERICIDYRLRFLNSSYFKAELPYEAISKIKHLEKIHSTKLEGFKIMAPAKLFKLENADDPLLFAPIGNQYYYLIHSWGKDLHPFRKLMMWPFKQIENLVVLLLIVSLAFTSVVPPGMFGQHHTTAEFLIIYLFMFKWLAGMTIFFGFKKGKNFSEAIWRSKFYNA
ncbi:hypothetical protein JM83_3709 [Gillisia sp. Hel_I_86]|uniref:hypothetical protein n=1 Tax=Gillisia sp. Hel_I_86 TaxID=1249981 RepID=UPI001199DE9C|nr:hypothetical protein [Gillisia sp. Hel_I_86]TVZ28575.1 hypothetical protein JM83_3709 [Gillisia sp. Hel_I_86]